MYTILLVLTGMVLMLCIRELSRKPVVIISEVCASNRGILVDEDGEYADFIEVYNAGEIPVNLKGYYLSDNDNKPLRWSFPSQVLEPGQYAYVYASGKEKVQADGIAHTNFSLSQDGEPVILSDPRGVAVSRTEPFAGLDNVSYAWIEELEGYAYLAIPTPGSPNTGAYALNPSELQPANTWLMISEYMSQNSSILPDEEGLFHDWVEVYNPNDIAVSLVGWSLSDNGNNLKKWIFPAGYTLEPGAYVTVYLSGLDKPGHVTFKLSERDGTLYLTDPNGRKADEIKTVATPMDVSYGRLPDGTEGYFMKPSPGAANEGPPAPELSALEWDAPKVRIMEYMSTNNFYIPDEEGDYNDWVELYNYGTEEINLSGCMLSDTETRLDKWLFEDGTRLSVGQRMVVQLSGKKLAGHANFSLGKDDDGVYLSDRNGRVIDKAPLVMPQDHVSYGRDESDADNWLFFPRPTPGEPNTTEGFTELGGISALAWRGLYISEASHENWVEIGNATNEAVNMAGWNLRDSENGESTPLPDKVIQPGSFVKVDVGFGIKTRGETLVLTDSEGSVRDLMNTGSLKSGVTSGRAGTMDARVYFASPTPGQPNDATRYGGYAGEVRADIEDGYVVVGTQVTLTAPQGGTIRYTLDGTEPTSSSPAYGSPIAIQGPVVLRACAFDEGKLPGRCLTRTYLTGERHTLPVVAITTDPKNLFDHNIGIFADGPGWTEKFPHKGANYWKDWERPIHFAFYDESGKLCVESDAGVKTFGQYSRAEAQKALAIQFRKDYGINRIAYPFFPGNDVSEYGSLLLRASGQDWNTTKLRDAFMSKSVQEPMELDLMDARPVAVYINGEYWGLYNLREKINEDYFETRYGVPTDAIDIIKANNNNVAGSNKAYVNMVETLTKMDTTTDEAYAYIDANIDLTNWMDYWIMETYFVNTDSGNIKCWRASDGSGKWRWIMFDVDWGLFPSTYDDYPVSRMIDPKGHGVGKMFSTKIARAILKNKRIRDAFVERYRHHLETTFQPERMIGILDAYADQIRPEMQRQIDRWGGISSIARWEQNVDRIRNILKDRHGMIENELKEIINYR